MKRLAFVMFLGLFAFEARAQASVSYLDEMEALGYVAGQGMACGASKYDTFEMLARAILITKAGSDAEQAQGMQIYNEKKASSYFSKKMDGYFECAKINRQFDAQGIFKMRLYADGTIDMPDGTVFTPRVPYDASLVYDKNNNGVKEAEKIYAKGAIKAGEKIPVEIKSESPARASKAQRPLIVTPNGSYEMPDASASSGGEPQSSVSRISRKK